MRIADVVMALKERQTKMEKDVFGMKTFDPVSFAREQGRYQGITEAIMVISDAVRKNEDQD